MKQKGHVWAAACAALLCMAFAALTFAESPSWWSTVVDTNLAPNDFAPVLAGQLKWMATNAATELETLPGGAGTGVHGLVNSFTLSNNYVPINLGQLKNTAAPFYQRLMAVGYATNYPWSETTADDADFAPAMLGQLKYVFDFDVSTDSDEDDLPDWMESLLGTSITNVDSDADGLWDGWEYAHDLNPASSNNVLVDLDKDGLTLEEEHAWKTAPGDNDTDGDGVPDGWELQFCLDPLNNEDGADDPDFDGVASSNEFLQGTNPKMFSSRSFSLCVNGDFAGWHPTNEMLLTSNALWTYYGHLDAGTNRLTFETHYYSTSTYERIVEGWQVVGGGQITAPMTTQVAFVSGWPSTNFVVVPTGGLYRIDLDEISSNLCVVSANSVPADFAPLCEVYRLGLSFDYSATYEFSNYFHRTTSGVLKTTFHMRPMNSWVPASVNLVRGNPWGTWWGEENQTQTTLDVEGVAERWIPGVNDYGSLNDIRIWQTSQHSNVYCAVEFDPTSGTYAIRFHASGVDSDGDGISDYGETRFWGTDPGGVDTDGDGWDDGYEVLHGTEPATTYAASGIQRNWLYHGNDAMLPVAEEHIPGRSLFSARFLMGPRFQKYLFHVIADPRLALGTQETASVSVRLDRDGVTEWMSAPLWTSVVVNASNAFHGLPTLGVHTLSVYRAAWTPCLYTNLTYVPRVQVLNAQSQVVDEVYLVASNIAGSAVSNWLSCPQYLAGSASSDYAFRPLARPNGSNVVVIYNSSWTNDSNEDGVQDSYEVALYYANRRAIPTGHMLGAAFTFDTNGTAGWASKEEVYGLLTNMQAKIASIEEPIYYLAVCYGVPVYMPGGSVDSFLIDANSNATYFAVHSAFPAGRTHSYVRSSSDPCNSVSLSELRHRDPTNYTIYLPCRIDGPTVEIAKGLVDKALYAETYLQDGGGSATSRYQCVAMSDEWYVDVFPHWKSQRELASDVKNLFIGNSMSQYQTPLGSGGEGLQRWRVLHDNYGEGRWNALVGCRLAANVPNVEGSVPRLIGWIAAISSTSAVVRMQPAYAGRDESLTWSGYEGLQLINASGNSSEIMQVQPSGSLTVASTAGFATGEWVMAYMGCRFPLSNVVWHSSYYEDSVYYDVYQWRVGAVSFQHESHSVEGFRDLATVFYANRALARGATAIAGPVSEPWSQDRLPHADLAYNSFVQGFSWAEAAHQAYPYDGDGIQRWATMVVGDPLYAPFSILWAGTERIDSNAPILARVTNSFANCASNESIIIAELGTNDTDAALDVALFKVEYGSASTSLTNVVDYIIWPNPTSSVFDISRRYWYGRRLSERITNIVAGTTCWYRVSAMDPYGNETASDVYSFQR